VDIIQSSDHLTTREEFARLIDHTLLRPTATSMEFDRLCYEALTYSFWSVCVPPSVVRYVVIRLGRSPVKVCTVVGFPFGYNTTESKLAEARKAVEDGAEEMDMVLNIGALKSGDSMSVFSDVKELADYGKRSGMLLKVILECCYLTDAEKVSAARIAERAGADFVKTSTGFGPGGATVADVALLKQTLTRGTKVKAAGGIGTLSKALSMIEAGADRLGTSSGAAIMKELSLLPDSNHALEHVRSTPRSQLIP
jgi:deoxyribose-phosphate aldolase